MKSKLPGIIVCTILGFLSILLAPYSFGLGATTLALLIGIICGNLFSKFNLSQVFPGAEIVDKKLLPIAIAFVGIKLNLIELKELGFKTMFIIVAIVVSVIAIGFLIARLFGLNKKQAILLGVGNAVCGSSAIAGVNKVVKADEESVGLSIAAVNLMGTLLMFLLPAILKLLNYSDIQNGTIIGGSLQAVGQAVAAAFSMSDEVGKIAVIVKMGRVLMLGLVIITFSLFYGNKSKKSFPVPLFVVAFFIMSLINTYVPLDPKLIGYISKIGKILLCIAMSGIGMRIVFSKLFKQGPKVLLAELTIGTVQIILMMLFVLI